MKILLNYYKSKYRHSSLLRPVFDLISKFGIRITPYYLFRETVNSSVFSSLSRIPETYQFGFWGEAEIREMAKIPDRKVSETVLIKRLNQGHRCVGLKKDGKLLSFSWCNFKEMTFRWHRIPIKKNEVYLFDAFTVREYRGKGLAPLIRKAFYRELHALGIQSFYSYSDYFNTPAVRFKEKLQAEKVALNLYIVLFKRWPFHFCLKSYFNNSDYS